MNESTIKNYIEAGRALQRRYDEIRTGIAVRDSVLHEHFKPLLKPLQDIRNQVKPLPSPPQITPKQIQGIPSIISLNLGPLATKYLGYNASKNVKTDKTFGLRIERDRLMIGNVEVTLNKDDLILGDNHLFKGTPGLWELLTLDQPSMYTAEDMKNYAKIIQFSNAWRQNNDPTNPKPKSSGGSKYKKIIKPILPILYQHTEKELDQLNRSIQDEDLLRHEERPEEDDDDILRQFDPLYRQGTGLRKILTHSPVEYKRWNTIDELLEQLYIDIGEIKAGNNSPHIRNDIVDILREIKEEYEL